MKLPDSIRQAAEIEGVKAVEKLFGLWPRQDHHGFYLFLKGVEWLHEYLQQAAPEFGENFREDLRMDVEWRSLDNFETSAHAAEWGARWQFEQDKVQLGLAKELQTYDFHRRVEAEEKLESQKAQVRILVNALTTILHKLDNYDGEPLGKLAMIADEALAEWKSKKD